MVRQVLENTNIIRYYRPHIHEYATPRTAVI